jgi:hypothetical protein
MTDLFSAVNGHRLTVDPVDGDVFVRSVGGDHLSIDAIAAWLQSHSAAVD